MNISLPSGNTSTDSCNSATTSSNPQSTFNKPTINIIGVEKNATFSPHPRPNLFIDTSPQIIPNSPAKNSGESNLISKETSAVINVIPASANTLFPSVSSDLTNCNAGSTKLFNTSNNALFNAGSNAGPTSLFNTGNIASSTPLFNAGNNTTPTSLFNAGNNNTISNSLFNTGNNIGSTSLFNTGNNANSSNVGNNTRLTGLFNNTNLGSVSTPKTATFNTSSGSGLFATKPNAGLFENTSAGLFQMQNNSVNTAKIMKAYDKREILFNPIKNDSCLERQFKSENEKFEILFKMNNFRILDQQNQDYKAHKDPHGLSWLYNEEEIQRSLTHLQVKSTDLSENQENKPKNTAKIHKDYSHENSAFQFIKSQKSSTLKFHENYWKPSIYSSSELQYKPFSPKYTNKSITKGISNLLINISSAKPKSEGYLPKLVNFEYKTKPPLETLYKYTINELRCVEDFCIENQHGRIQFTETIDMVSLDLDSSIKIEKGAVSVILESSKPNHNNQGINKPALITLYNCHPKKPVPYNEFVNVLKILCTNNGAVFESWDKTSGEWNYYVNNFNQCD